MTAASVRVFAPNGEEADPKALAQIQMVMADERAVAGALMADHHLGYSMGKRWTHQNLGRWTELRP